MERKVGRAFALLPLVFLTSCGAIKAPEISDYFNAEDIVFHEGFKVLQLTDIHWSVNTDMAKQEAYLDAVVAASHPDFIMITGDCFLGATTSTAESLIKVMEGWNTPFAVTWGNHDREGDYSPAWLSNLFKNAQHSFYNEVDDHVFGRSNYVVSLKDTVTGKPAWNLYAIDSNSYLENSNRLYYDYDIIHDDQITWFKQAAAYSAAQNGGNAVPGLAYFHIPLWEWYDAYLENQQGMIGEILESTSNSLATEEIKERYAAIHQSVRFWPGYQRTAFFDEGVKAGVKGFFCGHDHSNDWGTNFTSSAGTAYIGYGVKSGPELYYTHSDKRGFDILGGSLSTLHQDGSFDLTHYYVQLDPGYSAHTEEIIGL